MKVRNVSSRPREIGVTGQLVEPGDTVDVSDELGRSLCEQPRNWKRAPEPKSDEPKAPKAASEEQ